MLKLLAVSLLTYITSAQGPVFETCSENLKKGQCIRATGFGCVWTNVDNVKECLHRDEVIGSCYLNTDRFPEGKLTKCSATCCLAKEPACAYDWGEKKCVDVPPPFDCSDFGKKQCLGYKDSENCVWDTTDPSNRRCVHLSEVTMDLCDVNYQLDKGKIKFCKSQCCAKKFEADGDCVWKTYERGDKRCVDKSTIEMGLCQAKYRLDLGKVTRCRSKCCGEKPECDLARNPMTCVPQEV